MRRAVPVFDHSDHSDRRDRNDLPHARCLRVAIALTVVLSYCHIVIHPPTLRLLRLAKLAFSLAAKQKAQR
jgi:hypothetical protein